MSEFPERDISSSSVNRDPSTSTEAIEPASDLLSSLAQRMTICGWLLVISGVIAPLASFFQAWQMGFNFVMMVPFSAGSLIGTAISIAIGVLMLRAAASVSSVVTLHGGDLRQMGEPIAAIKRLFGFQYWLIIVIIVLVLVAIAAAVLFAFV